ncbi:E1-E2 ATPase domain containing protein [Amanita muscaria]
MEIETTIHIQNLHCESCVSVIQQSLNSLSPTPSTIDVSLRQRSVRVIHDPGLLLQKIQAALLDTGFDIVVEALNTKGENDGQGDTHFGKAEIHERVCILCNQTSGLQASSTVPTLTKTSVEGQADPDQYKLTLSVGGMTCSSCTRAITEAMGSIRGVDKAAVSLFDSSAYCRLEEKKLADLVREAIEDCGYEARVVRVEREHQPIATEVASTRTVALKIDGVSSAQCAKRITAAIESIGDGIVIEKTLAIPADPIVVVSYVPRPPSFTIRNIVSVIESSNNPPYRVAVHHPPSLEECTKTMQARETRNVLFRLIFATLAAIPTFIIGIVYMTLIKDGNPGKMYLMEPIWGGNASRSEWALFFIATPVMTYSANVFHRSAVKEVMALWKKGSSVSLLRRFTRFGSMNLLVSCGVTVAYVASLALLVLAATRPQSERSDNTTYFDAVVFLTMFLLMGRFIDIKSKSRTVDAITALSSLRPSEALLTGSGEPSEENSTGMLPGSKIRKVPVDLLEIGDVICVPYGATPSADGTLIDGETSMFDESSLTGESRLVSKQPGDKVYIGTINKSRTVHVKVDATGERTMLQNIVKVVREGQTRHAPIERVADIITSYFVPVITLFAIATWLVWLVLGYSGALPRDYLDIETGGWAVWSLRFAIAVFVVACPCGIGLAAPTAFIVGMGIAAKGGILAQGGGEAFQEMSQLDVLVFDKTGTLTEGGEPQVSGSFFVDEGKWNEDTIKDVAAELEKTSSHPLAVAIRQHCSRKSTGNLMASDLEEVPGRGLKANFKSLQCTAVIGSEKWMNDHGAIPGDTLSEQLERWKLEGKSVALVSICDDEQPADQRKFLIVAAFAISDTLRSKAVEVVRWFQKQGIDTWMITGDNPKTADAIASLVGIPRENVIAGVLPHEKSEKVQQLQQGQIGSLRRGAGRNIVAMVGDGINDAPALAVADVGIAIGSGSDVAISSASFILVSSNLQSLITLCDLSTRVINRVKFNFGWALIYNIIAVPVAAGAIYPARHVRLDPAWASLAMALSSCSVIVSSLLLQTYKAPKTT